MARCLAGAHWAKADHMHYVYVLKSKSHPGRFYTGETDDLRRRFKQHNAGSSQHTAKYIPWQLIWYAGFALRSILEIFRRAGFSEKTLRLSPVWRANQSPLGRRSLGEG